VATLPPEGAVAVLGKMTGQFARERWAHLNKIKHGGGIPNIIKGTWYFDEDR